MGDTQEPTLRFGDQSIDGWVEYLQQLLVAWGFRDPSVPFDGNFDQATLQGVHGFQTMKALLVDGVVGNQTWAALQEEAPEAIGTDGLEPHTFVEVGAEARWLTERQVGLESDDRFAGAAFNTGSVPIVDGQFTAEGTVFHPDGTSESTTMFSTSRNGQPVQPGELFDFVGAFGFGFKLKASGNHVFQAIMAAELGGDIARNEFEIVVDAVV